MKTIEELIKLLKTDVKAFNQYRQQTDYDWIDLSECNFYDDNLEGAHLQRVNLAETNMECANLKKVNFSFSYLTGANMQSANLKKADFSFADLTGANFRWADMRWVNINEAKINENQAITILKGLAVKINDK